MLTFIELPLVVAELPDWRQQRILDICLLHLVLHVQAACDWLRVEFAILQLQLPRLCRVWPAHRDCGLFSSLRIRAACLQVGVDLPST